MSVNVVIQFRDISANLQVFYRRGGNYIMGEVYGYARVSTTDQNLARQLEQLKQFGIPERNIRCDKVSGKTFNRRE